MLLLLQIEIQNAKEIVREKKLPCYQHARETVAADANLGEVKRQALLFPASPSYYR